MVDFTKNIISFKNNVIKPLAKSVLTSLGLTAAGLAGDAKIHKKILGSGHHHCSSSAPHNKRSSAPKTTTLKYQMMKLKTLLT